VNVSFTQNDDVRAHLGHVRVLPRSRTSREIWILLPPRIPRRSFSEKPNFELPSSTGNNEDHPRSTGSSSGPSGRSLELFDSRIG